MVYEDSLLFCASFLLVERAVIGVCVAPRRLMAERGSDVACTPTAHDGCRQRGRNRGGRG